MSEGKHPELNMLSIFGLGRKNMQKVNNAKRNPEFQSEPSTSLVKQLSEYYDDNSFHKNCIRDTNNKIISLEVLKRRKVLITITREELLKNNSIITRENGAESISRYSIGVSKPDKAMWEVILQDVQEPVSLSKNEESKTTFKRTGAARIAKAKKDLRIDKLIEENNYLDDDDWSVEASIHKGARKLDKEMKRLKNKKESTSKGYLSDCDEYEDTNINITSSKLHKNLMVENNNKDLSDVDYLSD